MVTSGVEDVRDDIVSGAFFSSRFFEDSVLGFVEPMQSLCMPGSFQITI